MSRTITLPAARSEERPVQKTVLSAEITRGLIVGQVPQLFGKLVWISSFRTGTTEEYRSQAFDRALGPVIAQEALNHTHQRLFAQVAVPLRLWIGQPEEMQSIIAEFLAAK